MIDRINESCDELDDSKQEILTQKKESFMVNLLIFLTTMAVLNCMQCVCSMWWWFERVKSEC